jgi:hypothetical protein
MRVNPHLFPRLSRGNADSTRKKHIPPDLVVKSQAVDMTEVI